MIKQIVDAYNKVYVDGLTDAQRSIVGDDSHYKIIQGVRRSGKTKIIKAIAFLTAMFERDKTIVITTANLQMGKLILQDIKKLYDEMSWGVINKPKITTNRSDALEFDNGSRIYLVACHCCSVRGLTIDVLLMDEAAFIEEKRVTEFWDAAKASLMWGDRRVIIVSTRFSRSTKKNFFWRVWTGAVKGDNLFKPLKLKNSFSRKELKKLRNGLGRKIYEKEFTLRSK
jgi:phage FluMu gp28-like protein